MDNRAYLPKSIHYTPNMENYYRPSPSRISRVGQDINLRPLRDY